MSRPIVLTGATRGLGRALTAWLADHGERVVGCGRDAEAVAELAAAHSPPHAFARVDVSDDASVAAWAGAVLEAHGPPDLLVCNAAVINAPAALWEVPRAEFDQLIDVNVKGVANVLRHFLPAMIAAGRGIVVNLSSGWGRSTSPQVAPYCASKHAIEGLTKALAQELPAGLAAIPLNPGIIDTDMLRSCWGEGAAGFPDAETWAETAGPFLLALRPAHNGRPLTVGDAL
ncbi:MAG: SDR family oxidoreductase [Verrucomicrobiota bacterium]